MPAANPRLSVTLSPSVAAVLREIARLTDSSQSALIGELLEVNLPVFERMQRLLSAAEKVKEEHRATVAQSMQAAHSRIEKQLGLVLGEWDRGAAPLLEAAEKIDRRSGRGARSASRPERRAGRTPMSNRGVTPHPKQKNQGKTRRGR